MVSPLWLILVFAIGAAFLFIASNRRVRLWLIRHNSFWDYAKTDEEKETREAFSMLTPLLAGILITSGAVAIFLIWLLA